MHTTASTVLAGMPTRIQERTGLTTDKLKRAVSKDLQKMGLTCMGRSRCGSSWQKRVVLECGQMCPVRLRDEPRSRL